MTSSEEHTSARVGVVVLNYNGAWVLPKLLESLDKIQYPDYKVFLVDNASTDGSLVKAENHLPAFPMDIIANEKNLFFSGGNNVGIDKALEWGADFILLLNNDTVVPPMLVSQLVDFLKGNESAGIAGPMIHFREPKDTIWSAGGEVSLKWGLVRHYGIREKDTGQFPNPAKVDYVSGCAMMVRREVFEKIGKLDEAFPMYFEDTDFCFRAAKAGFETWYVPTEPLIHLVSVAAGGQVSKFKVERRFRSGMKFYARHAKWYQWPTILIGQVYEAVRVGMMVRKGEIG